MPFVKVNVKEEIKYIKKANPEFVKVYDAVKKESELTRQARKLRKELDETQVGRSFKEEK